MDSQEKKLKISANAQSHIPCLLQLFRQHGYDGATLAKISEATGLGKASLYHHFPGGKDQMVEVVLDFVEGWVDENIARPLQSDGEALTRLQGMCDRISELYENGEQPCILAILLMGSGRDLFHAKVSLRLREWIEAIAAVLIEAGTSETLAKQRAENAVIAIQGSLILSRGLDDPTIFQRVIQEIPGNICQEL